MVLNDISLLDQQVSNRIRSAQVIVGIESAIKELIENSLDSNCRNIDVRFQEYGLESMEVIDDGCGIKKPDFDKLTKRNYTSKLRQDDLTSVTTYGYRGEALFALSHLSKLTITSRHGSEKFGTKAQFENGQLVNTSSIAREVGTTVIVSRLFENIPVRRHELVKQMRKQFSRAEQTIEAYSLISRNVRISFSNSLLSISVLKPKMAWSSLGGNSLEINLEFLVGKSVFDTFLQLEPIKVEISSTQRRGCSKATVSITGKL
ncbi:Mismatch repair endonuclease PMS2 [Thelohanellus kitauei]|uniref:Mismatch repair endonuclease PMS2 n=1 Tax=Thelohanellus kitauei TaxID=669202 RepID=A0A0C2MSP9_THEKT|nr:Mismatch repair endonuclease PMS2 [Thelohanellus kitauei]